MQEARLRLGDMLEVYSYHGRVEAQACRWPFCGPPLRAGVRLPSAGCTVGFLVRGRFSNNPYMLTAGHCLDGSATKMHWTRFANGTRHDIGRRQAFIYGERGDMGIVRIRNPKGWKPRPWVYVLASPDQVNHPGGPVAGTTLDRTYRIRRDGLSTQGMRVCISAAYGHRTNCGRVASLGHNVLVHDHNGPCHQDVLVRNLARATYCSTDGASGAPVYARHTAFGINVAGNDRQGCRVFNYYQGIRAAQDRLNVNLVFARS